MNHSLHWTTFQLSPVLANLSFRANFNFLSWDNLFMSKSCHQNELSIERFSSSQTLGRQSHPCFFLQNFLRIFSETFSLHILIKFHFRNFLLAHLDWLQPKKLSLCCEFRFMSDWPFWGVPAASPFVNPSLFLHAICCDVTTSSKIIFEHFLVLEHSLAQLTQCTALIVAVFQCARSPHVWWVFSADSLTLLVDACQHIFHLAQLAVLSATTFVQSVLILHIVVCTRSVLSHFECVYFSPVFPDGHSWWPQRNKSLSRKTQQFIRFQFGQTRSSRMHSLNSHISSPWFAAWS